MSEAQQPTEMTAEDECVLAILHHIDEMYPEMWKNVPRNARLSIRNTIYAELKKLKPQGQTIRIKQAGREIGRVTAEKLEYALKVRGSCMSIPDVFDDMKVFTAKDASGKPLFVVRVSEDKNIITEKI